MGVADKIGMVELVGTALAGAGLGDSEGGERPVVRVAAFGVAQLKVVENTPIAEQDYGKRLAALLFRAKYGRDSSSLSHAVFLLGMRLRFDARKRKRLIRNELMFIRVAEQAVREFVSDACTKCDGTGRRGITLGALLDYRKACRTCVDDKGVATGQIEYLPSSPGTRSEGIHEFWRKVTGGGLAHVSMMCPECKGARYILNRKQVPANLGKTCTSCGGEGRAKPSHSARARALQVSLKTYEHVWQQMLDSTAQHLKSMERLLLSSLRDQLERGIKPTQ